MKMSLKILRVAVITASVTAFILFILSLLLQSQADIFLTAVNNNLSTKIETGSLRLSLLRKFPRASFELKEVLVHSSPGFNKESFTGIGTDTLLRARSISVVFSMTDLIFGNYTVNRIVIRSGQVNLLTDSEGKINYDIYWTGTKESDQGGGLILNLDRVFLSYVRTVYSDLSSNLLIEGLFTDGQLKSRISGNNIDFYADTRLLIDLFQVDNLKISRSFMAEANLNLHKTDSGVKFSKGIFRVEDWDFLVTGSVSADKYIDLDIKGNNIDLSKINRFFPPGFQAKLSAYRPSGRLEVSGTIKGPFTGSLSPNIDFSYSLENANVKYAKSRLGINDLSFTGSFTNGSGTSAATSTLTVQSFTGKLGSAQYRGSLRITDLTRPSAEIKLSGTLFPSELKEFFNLKNLSRTGGSASLNLNITGRLNKKEKYVPSDFLGLISASEITFKSFSMGFQKENLWFDDVSGTLHLARRSVIKDISLLLNGQRIRIDGEVTNFPGWLAGNPAPMAINANLYSDSFSPESFGTTEKNPDSSGEAAIEFPENIIADVTFRIDTLRYKSFTGDNISGIFSYKPGMANFKSFTIKSQGGSISGNCLFVQNPGKSITGRGSFSMNSINVNEAFVTFRNFGQDFIRAENLAGTLSGSLSLLLPFDRDLKPVVGSVTAEGKYVLTNGELRNFEPVKQLSSFIELSELENISFHQLENDFFIRDSYFYIPQMDVRSSAANISVNGRHGFDNHYEYHVRVQLSELLSRKAVKKRPPVTEFGVIEDDGLGRTSLLLKVESQGDATRVSYDVKAATARIKEDIRNERQNLKSILSEEYNRYQDDTVLETKAGQKPRFRISWEDGEKGKDEGEDESKGDDSKADRQNLLRNIFRKKL